MNTKIKVYIDQNVISNFYGKPLGFTVPNTFQIVYSPALFDDFRVSKNPEFHLNTLKNLDACMVYFDAGDTPKFNKDETVEKLFQKNEQWRQETLVDECTLDELRAMSSSGRGFESSKKEWDRYIAAQLKKAAANNNHLGVMALKVIDQKMNENFQTLKRTGETKLGVSLPGVVNSDNYTPPDALKKLWEDTADKNLHPTPEDYFGFVWPNGKPFPRLTAFDTCCGIFDRYEFLAEPKRKKPKSQKNVQNDAKHLAYATTCDFLISSDKNLIKRALVIYSHFQYHCKPVWLDPTTPIDCSTLEQLEES
ncbi:hypothetical protein [Gilvimarinus chinensis]|uniref:hypothetical protein n=1 Tax=Gilvimarinus chinensis TaxID=396005 RepID=UPI000369F76C|nr:hypothetical protein [Gilvimarinus chinensis]